MADDASRNCRKSYVSVNADTTDKSSLDEDFYIHNAGVCVRLPGSMGGRDDHVVRIFVRPILLFILSIGHSIAFRII